MKGNQIKLGAILSYVSMGLKIVISILYTPVMLRILGQQEYGLYQLAASIVSNLSILSLGFGSSYVRFYTTSRKEGKSAVANLNGMFLMITGVLAVIALFVGIVLAQNPLLVFGSKLTQAELGRAQYLLVILVINLALSFFNMVFNGYIIANENFIFQRVLEIIQALTSPFLQLPLLLLGFGSIGVVIGTTVTSIIIYGMNIRHCFQKLDMVISFKKFDFKFLKEIGQYSSFIFIAMLIDQINWSIDVYLVGRFKGTEATAVYSIAELIDSYFRNFSSAFTSVLIPTIHNLIAGNADDETVSRLFAKIGRVQYSIMSLFGLGFIFFGRPFIYFWAGEGYLDAYNIALVLIYPLIFITSQNVGIEIRRAKNRQVFYTKVSFMTALLNIILTALFLTFLPPISAAFSTSITLILNSILLNWDYHKNLGMNMEMFWLNIAKISKALVPPIICGVLLTWIFNLYNIWSLLVAGVIFICAYISSMWFLGLNKEEKQLINIERFK